MSRSMFDIHYKCGADAARKKTDSIFMSNGYKQKTLRSGEVVWKKGIGLLTAMKFAKVEYYEEKMIIYGWVSMGIGSVHVGEMNLEGAFGIIPKRSLKDVLDKVKNAFQSEWI